jgi:hypothetical protein
MRIWTIHPRYLDTKGLLAAWRETLLAQKVLQGATRGYRNHPQLTRFKAHADPPGAIAKYLRAVYEEASSRGYKFSEQKIGAPDESASLVCTRGQLLYEWNHLKEKLKARDARRFSLLENISEPEAHPLFTIVEGEVESWEITKERLR